MNVNTTSCCPCGLALPYLACCGRYIEQDTPAPTPVALMRSRYTAFTQANVSYLEETMSGVAKSSFNVDEAAEFARTVLWVGLEVHADQFLSTTQATVTFTAYFRTHGALQSLYEKSLFHKISGRWYYTDCVL